MTTNRTLLELSKDHTQKITKYKKRTGIAKTNIIRQALEEFFEKHSEQEG